MANYLAFCTFDLKGATSQDYANAYADLAKLGLQRVVKTDNGKDYVIPTTAAMGSFNHQSAGGLSTQLRDSIAAAFKARKFKSEIFLVVGNDWAWAGTTT